MTDPNLHATSARLPAPDCDILYGVSGIASWFGMSPGQIRPMIREGIIPTFKVRGKSTVYALKSQVTETFVRYSRR